MTYEGIYTSNAKHVLMSVMCSKCGTKIDDGWKHCPECGHKFEPLPKRLDTTTFVDAVTKQVRKGVIEEFVEEKS